MERVLIATQATLAIRYEVNGTPTDPSPATTTVTITRADGTAIVTNAAATRTSVGVFTYTLSPAQTALLDNLTLAWTSTLGTLRTYAEIVGGFLFTISDARAVKPLDNATRYSDDQILAARTTVEQELEDACGVAFVPRYARETLQGDRTHLLNLQHPQVTAIREVRVDGTALTAGELSELRIAGLSSVYRPAHWPSDYGSVTIGYEHGYTQLKAPVSRAALLLAKQRLVDTPIDDRAMTMTTDEGTFSLVTPGMRGAWFSIPDVNAVVKRYRIPVVV